MQPAQPQKRMPRYDVRNDGVGPYGVFYCDRCSREYRSQPDITGTITKDIGRDAMGSVLRGIPLFGRAVADNVVGEDPRYTYHMTPQQIDAAWKQVEDRFRACPTCLLTVCLSCFDSQSGYCNEDSPRREEIAEAQAEQAAGVAKGFASAFGFGAVVSEAMKGAKAAAAMAPKCSKCGLPGPVGTKFCPECGGTMVQPAADLCPSCGAEARGAKFCPECGSRIERAPAAPPAPALCGDCGTELKPGARFCPECGARAS